MSLNSCHKDGLPTLLVKKSKQLRNYSSFWVSPILREGKERASYLLIFLEGIEGGEAGLAMHNMTEIPVGRVPCKQGAKGALSRVRSGRRGGRARGSSFRQGRLRWHRHSPVAEVIRHSMPSFVIPSPQLRDPRIRRLHIKVEILRGQIRLDETLILGRQKTHVLLKHRVAGAVDEPRRDGLDGLGEVRAAEPHNQHGLALPCWPAYHYSTRQTAPLNKNPNSEYSALFGRFQTVTIQHVRHQRRSV